MAKTKILNSSEVTAETRFRVKIVKWDVYQKNLKGEEADASGRVYVKVRVVHALDTMLREPLPVRGLFWELLRFSGAGRRPGWVVAGNDEPMTFDDLAFFLRLTTAEIQQPLLRLADSGRIQLWLSESELAESEQNYPRPSENIPDQADITAKSRVDESKEEKSKVNVEDGGKAATLRSRSKEDQDRKDQEFKTQFHVEWEDWVIRKTQANPEKRDFPRAHKMLDAFIKRYGLYPVNRLFNAFAGRGTHSLDEFFAAVKKLPNLPS